MDFQKSMLNPLQVSKKNLLRFFLKVVDVFPKTFDMFSLNEEVFPRNSCNFFLKKNLPLFVNDYER